MNFQGNVNIDEIPNLKIINGDCFARNVVDQNS